MMRRDIKYYTYIIVLKKVLEVGEYLINSEKLEQVLKNINIVRR